MAWVWIDAIIWILMPNGLASGVMAYVPKNWNIENLAILHLKNTLVEYKDTNNQQPYACGSGKADSVISQHWRYIWRAPI